ncbi:hypothetical protein BRI6_1590 [plant metagenome]|uniref:Uncharacterized protein n=1 Tax=plant metagenome TaxID=1297885 RepID=A0A484PU45_9ZZZZ
MSSTLTLDRSVLVDRAKASTTLHALQAGEASPAAALP